MDQLHEKHTMIKHTVVTQTTNTAIFHYNSYDIMTNIRRWYHDHTTM